MSTLRSAYWARRSHSRNAKAHARRAQIDKTDAAIDVLVHQLYGLTEEEVRVVEGKN